MKYDENLFQISTEYYKKMEDKDCNVDEKEEKEFLKFFFEKFQKKVKEDYKILEYGIVKVIINNYGHEKEAYSFIRKLIESGEFDRFGKEYCFLLGKVEKKNYAEDKDSYVEFIWDYQRYFETFSLNLLKQEGTLKESHPEFTKMFENFKELPSKYQMAIVETFIENVKMFAEKYEHELILEKCKKEGHRFSMWQKKFQDVYPTVENTFVGSPTKQVFWERICNRCGFIESVEKEPQELINQRKEKEEEILRLERRIKELKESM